MQLAITSNLTQLTRQELLRIWMLRNGITFTQLGHHLGITSNAVSKLCLQDTMPTRRHRALVSYGVPPDLLPLPVDLKTGPKSKKKHSG
jgi:hypothetical protein